MHSRSINSIMMRSNYTYVHVCLVASVILTGYLYILYPSNLEYRRQPTVFIKNVSSPGCKEMIGDRPCIDYAKRLPNCLIIGMMKCGTFALLKFVSAHPKVVRNESYVGLNFFGQNGHFRYGYAWYMDQMPYSCPDQFVIEGTPDYVTTETAPERIAQMNPNIHLLLIVKSPVRRVISKYVMDKRQYEHSNQSDSRPFPSFESSWRNFTFKEHYADYLQKWLKVFKLGQHIHIIDGDAMVKYPVPELSKVENFLNIEHYLTDNAFIYNEKREFYCLRMLEESGMDCLQPTKGHSTLPPYVSTALIKEMHDYFRPHNQRFYNLTGRQFDWDTIDESGYMHI